MKIHIERGEKAARDPHLKDFRYAMRGVGPGVLLTADTVAAWYRLPGVRWMFLTPEEQSGILHQVCLARVGHVDKAVHERVIPRKYGPNEWGRLYTEANASIGLVPAKGRHARLIQEQWHLANEAHVTAEVYLGVEFTTPGPFDRFRPGRGLERLASDLADLDRVMAHPGLGGKRLTTEQMGWLIHRSVGLGLPDVTHTGAATYAAEDLPEFTAGVDRYPSRRHRAVRIVGERDGTLVERWACIVCIGRMDEQHIPGQYTPWVAHSQAWDPEVEWSIRYKIADRPSALSRIQNRLAVFDEQHQQLRNIGREGTDDELNDVTAHARQRRKEMLSGDPVKAADVTWSARAAVFGDTAKDAIAAATDFAQHYRTQMITTHRPWKQAALSREFVPGEPAATRAHTRHTGMRFLATGLPTMTTRLGDPDGEYLGYTKGVLRTPVMWSLWGGMRRRGRTGFIPVIGEQGSGKSFLLGWTFYRGVDSGIYSTIIDGGPGTFARIASIPERRHDTQVFNVLEDTRKGYLNPYWAVPDPPRVRFYEDPECAGLQGADLEGKVDDLWNDAKEVAKQTRVELAADSMRAFLDPRTLGELKAGRLIDKACANGPKMRTGQLASVLDVMHGMGEVAAELRDHYLAISQMRMPAKFFGVPDKADLRSLEDPKGLIISLAGMALPREGTPPESWSREERHNVAALNVVIHMMDQRTYSRPMREPKVTCIDEVGLLRPWRSGTTWMNTSIRNSRKWTNLFEAASQDPDDVVLALDVKAQIGDAFLGRCMSTEVAARCLPLVGVKEGYGFEEVLAELSPDNPDGTPNPGEFLARLAGATNRMQVDAAALPALEAALTPDAEIPGEAVA